MKLENKNHTDPVYNFIRGDGIRLIYSELLHRFPIDDVKKFLLSIHLDYNDHELTLKEIVEKIWLHGSMFPSDYIIRFINSLDPFCVKMNTDVTELLKQAFTELKNGNDLPVHVYTRAIALNGKMFDKPLDHRHWGINAFENIIRLISRQAIFKVVREESDKDWYNDYVLFSLDKTFSGKLPKLNCDLWMIPKIKYLPLCLNYPPYEEVISISDCRTIESILPESEIVKKDNCVFIDSQISGKAVRFSEFLKSKGIETLMIPEICDCEVVEITNQLYCSVRKREILHLGCVYGAPADLFHIRYKRSEKKTEDVLTYFFRKSVTPRHVWNLIKSKHRELVHQLETTYNFVYHENLNSIFMNGRLLVRNIPAMMLRKILYLYINGQLTFERKEFLDDSAIVYDRTNPGIEIRLKRLFLVLERMCPLFCVTRTDRGVFKIDARCQISVCDVP